MFPTGLVILLSESAETANLQLLFSLMLVRSGSDANVLTLTRVVDTIPDACTFIRLPKMGAEWKNKRSRQPHGGLALLRSYDRANNPVRHSNRNGSRNRR
jgi:hypothetical protein